MTERVGSVVEVAEPEREQGTGPQPVTSASTADGPRSLRPRSTRPVPLDVLAAGLGASTTGPAGAAGGVVHGTPGVTGITLDTRLVQSGDLFVGLPGSHHHGAAFAAAAAAAGAVAVLTDPAGAAHAGAAGLPVLAVPDPRAAMARAAARVYGEPARAMTMYAVTGTNGKTTTTYLLEAALRATGVRTGLVGTIGFRLDGHDLPAARTTVTTPESPELQALLAHLHEAGATAGLMEVSSHALVLGRADAIVFDVAAFTGLGSDHLDFHGDLESYFEAKALLFTPARTRHAVLNVDDPRGRVLLDRLARDGTVPVTTVSLGPAGDVHPLSIGPTERGLVRLRAAVRGQVVETRLALPGDHNVANALTALAMVSATGGDVAAAAAGLVSASVPGRMQRVDLGPDAPVAYVDFAHTPQAVAAALDAARLAVAGGPHGTGRLVAVLGSGGDRDPAKRGPMGTAAAGVADVVVVTDDNPRSEPPAAIRAQVLAGARAAATAGRRVEVLDGGDRRAALAAALALAGPEDVVAVLGKGHESGQEVAGRVLPFADADVLVQEWARRGAGA